MWSCGAVMLLSIDVKESGALQLAEMLRSRLEEIDLGPGARCELSLSFSKMRLNNIKHIKQS